MNSERVAERGLQASNARGARLKGYRLAFNKVSNTHPELAHANIMFAPSGEVEGVLYDLDSVDEILKMDPFERAPWNYGRDVVALETDQGEEWAWTYFANVAVLREGRLPPKDYVAHLLAGAEFLSDTYVEQLRAHPVGDE